MSLLSIVNSYADKYGLSQRESEVLRLIAVSRVVYAKDIGKRLFITAKTVNRHMNSILIKVKARNKTEVMCDILRYKVLADGD